MDIPVTASVISQNTILNAPAYDDPTQYQARLDYTIGLFDINNVQIGSCIYSTYLTSDSPTQIDSLDPSIASGIIATQLAAVQASISG